jgi:hypothetical protein
MSNKPGRIKYQYPAFLQRDYRTSTRIVKDPGNDSLKGYNTAMIPSDLMHPEFNDCRLRLVLLILMIFAFICGFADLIPNRSMALLRSGEVISSRF